MLTELKTELETIATALSADFVKKDIPEYEDYAQNYDFALPSINLEPLKTFNSFIDAGGATRFKADFNMYFMTKFDISTESEEDTKDAIIDTMITLSDRYFEALNRNERQVFSTPQWTWRGEILRQFTSNLTCGVKISISLETSCSRV